MSACNCCDEPPCNAPVVEWDSVSASMSKCGHVEFAGYESTPPKYFLVSTETLTGSWSASASAVDIPSTGSSCDAEDDSAYADWATVITYTEECGTPSTDYNGTLIRTIVSNNSFIPESPCTQTVTTTNGGSTVTDGDYCGCMFSPCTGTAGFTNGTPSVDATTWTRVDTYGGSSDGSGTCSSSGSRTTEIVLSEEYTTDMLKDNTEADLPTYDDDWNDTAGTYRNLNEDEDAYSIRMAKFRIRHSPTASCYFKVWFRAVFTPDDEEIEPTLGELQTYEWAGTDNPCLTDTDALWNAAENYIYDDSDGTEIPLPDTNGTITIEIVKYACIPDYEPNTPDDEGCQGKKPNGYPCPECEDCEA